MEGFRGASGRSHPSDFSRAPNKDEGAYAAATRENVPTATATKMILTSSSNIRSDLDLNDSPNYEVSNRLQRNSCRQQKVPNWIVEQRPDEAGIHNQHRDDNCGRQSHQEHHPKPALAGINPDLPQDFEALADGLSEVLLNPGRVSSSFTLPHDCV